MYDKMASYVKQSLKICVLSKNIMKGIGRTCSISLAAISKMAAVKCVFLQTHKKKIRSPIDPFNIV